MPLLSAVSAHRTSMGSLTPPAIPSVRVSFTGAGNSDDQSEGSWPRTSRAFANSFVKGRIRMKSLKSYLFIIGCMVLGLCAPAWAATVLNYDQPTDGTISSPAQTNSYSLSVNRHDVLNFTVVATESTSGTLGPCIVLYDPNGNQVDNAGGYSAQDVEMNGYVAKSSGTFTVTIQDCAGTDTGDYVVFVQKSNDPIGSVPLPYAKVKTGTIGSMAQSNAYTISANAKDVLNFTVVATSSTSGTLGPCILLYNTTGTPLLDNAGGYSAQDVEMNGYIIPATGTYNVFIKDCGDTATGDYALFVQKTNDPIDAVPIVYDQVQTGNIASAAQSNAYTLIGSLNDALNFTVVASSGTLGPCILLYNASGTPLLDDAGGYSAQNVEMSYKIPATGTYNVFIKDCADTATGNYTLNTECIAAGSSTCQLPVPILTSISPNSAIAGGPGFTLTVYGLGFASVDAKSVVEWNGTSLTTTFVSTTELTAAVPKADIANAGTDWVKVFTPAPGGGTSNELQFTVNNPVPTLASISPASALAGGPAFTLTVTGTNFVKTSSVQWNGNSLETTYVSGTELTAAVPATDIAIFGTVPVTVFSPKPGGGLSKAVPFTINNPVPDLKSISPTSATAGGPAFTITLTGSGFVPGSVVKWNGNSLAKTFVSPTELQAAVSMTDIASPGTVLVTVSNLTPGGGTSNSLSFTVNPNFPVIASLSPASAVVGGPAFTLTVNGSNFLPSSGVEWNGSRLVTTFVTSTELQAAVPAADIAAVGTASVTVVTPAPGGGTSNVVKFSIVNPVPIASSLSPNSAIAGGPAFTLIVTGSKFVNGATVKWRGSALSTTYKSATQLTAAVPAADIAIAGTFPVTVFNPLPGGGASNQLLFTVNNPKPVLASISPASIIAGGSGFTLTATGSGFVKGSLVEWNGKGLTTTYVSSTELQAAIPATDTLDGDISVTVYNTTPGGGSSNAITLAIDNPVPVVMSLSPASVKAGSGSFTLTVNGFDFNEGAKVQWNGIALSTVFVSDMQLQATVPASDVATAGSATVTVVNPAPTPSPSNPVTFTIN